MLGRRRMVSMRSVAVFGAGFATVFVAGGLL
jgi:hypothetical protein